MTTMNEFWKRETARCESNARHADDMAKLARAKLDFARAARWDAAASEYRASAAFARSHVGGRDS
jgi:hypothetical protein